MTMIAPLDERGYVRAIGPDDNVEEDEDEDEDEEEAAAEEAAAPAVSSGNKWCTTSCALELGFTARAERAAGGGLRLLRLACLPLAVAATAEFKAAAAALEPAAASIVTVPDSGTVGRDSRASAPDKLVLLPARFLPAVEAARLAAMRAAAAVAAATALPPTVTAVVAAGAPPAHPPPLGASLRETEAPPLPAFAPPRPPRPPFLSGSCGSSSNADTSVGGVGAAGTGAAAVAGRASAATAAAATGIASPSKENEIVAAG